MAKFDAGAAVEPLEFDFTAYGGGSGVISEPSTGRVNNYFADMKEMFREVNRLQQDFKDLDVETEMDDDALIDRMAKVDEASAGASAFQARTIENLAVLCGAERVSDGNGDGYTVVGGSPSVEDLNRLPYRVLQAFSTWLMEEIKPKRTTPGTKR